MGAEGKRCRVVLSVCVVVILAALTAFPVQSAPKAGGVVRMSLADSDVTSFDPNVPFDNMSIWTMLPLNMMMTRFAV